MDPFRRTNAEQAQSSSSSRDRKGSLMPLEDDGSDAGPKQSKRKQTLVACVPCQKRKSKCDGQRPTCSLCEKRLTNCEYDGNSASRRLGNLRRLNNEMVDKFETFEAQRALLLGVTDATNITDVKEIVEKLKDAEDEVAKIVAANRHWVGRPVEDGPLAGMSEDAEEVAFQTPDTAPLEDSIKSMWLAALARMQVQNKTIRLVPRDYIEIFGERWMGDADDPTAAAKGSSPPFSGPSDDSVFNSKLRVHQIQPRSTDDNSPLSRVASDYKLAARKAIAHGTPVLEILGPAEMDVSAFLNDERGKDSAHYVPRVDRWASLVNKSFEDVDVFVLLASVFFHWSLMRWMIYPTAKTYASLPNLVKPTMVQLFVPHAHALNFLPLPCLRDCLILQSGDLLSPVKTSLSCNWMGSLEDCLERDLIRGQVSLTNAFRQHVQSIENWSVSAEFIGAFPELEGMIPVESEPPVQKRVL